ncbi:MAG: hypothetical protein QM710_15065 [Flavobacterium sp.]
MTITIICLLAAIVLFAIYFLNQPILGKAPNGNRLERIRKSPNYKDGKFQNIHFTPTLSEGYSMSGIIRKQLFGKFPDRVPEKSNSIGQNRSEKPQSFGKRAGMVWAFLLFSAIGWKKIPDRSCF